MARRRYRSEALSTAAHETRRDEPAPPGQMPLSGNEPASPQPPAQDPTADAHFHTGLKEQLAQQQRYAQPDPLDQYIAHTFPGATPFERQWLRANSHHLNNPGLIHSAAAIALQRGVPRNSPEFLAFVSALLDQHHHAMHAQAPQPHEPPAPAPPPPPPEPMPPPMPHMTHVDIERDEHDHEPEATRMSAMVSAPVSRGEQSYSMVGGEPELSAGRITLSPQERDHARAAGVTDEIYAQNKLKMLKLKRH